MGQKMFDKNLTQTIIILKSMATFDDDNFWNLRIHYVINNKIVFLVSIFHKFVKQLEKA